MSFVNKKGFIARRTQFKDDTVFPVRGTSVSIEKLNVDRKFANKKVRIKVFIEEVKDRVRSGKWEVEKMKLKCPKCECEEVVKDYVLDRSLMKMNYLFSCNDCKYESFDESEWCE